MSRWKSIMLVLPEPPSINEKYISRNFNVSDEWKNYKKQVGLICMAERIMPFLCEVTMKINWYRSSKRGDIDSKLKCLLDALEMHAYENDSQVGELDVKRFEDKVNPRMVVTIKER